MGKPQGHALPGCWSNGAAASLYPSSHSGTILPQTSSFLGLIIKAEAPCVPSLCQLLFHTFVHIILHDSHNSTKRLSKLTLNYLFVQVWTLRPKEDNSSLATQTRKWLSQNLNLAFGFRVQIYYLCCARDGNVLNPRAFNSPLRFNMRFNMQTFSELISGQWTIYVPYISCTLSSIPPEMFWLLMSNPIGVADRRGGNERQLKN